MFMRTRNKVPFALLRSTFRLPAFEPTTKICEYQRAIIHMLHEICKVQMYNNYVLHYFGSDDDLPQVFEESDCDGSGMIDFEEFR